MEPVRSPRYTGTTFVRSPRSIDPDGISPTLRLRVVLAACDLEDGIGFRSLYLTRLYRFTVSHCGSRTPLPTLKPHLAAPAPRLSTGCSLRFAGSGLSPDCITCTELAHPPCTLYPTLLCVSMYYFTNCLCNLVSIPALYEIVGRLSVIL